MVANANTLATASWNRRKYGVGQCVATAPPPVVELVSRFGANRLDSGTDACLCVICNKLKRTGEDYKSLQPMR